MHQLTLYIDDRRLGTGFYTVLVVSEGRQVAQCLHVPTLTKLSLRLAEIARQRGTGMARDVPITRGLVGRLIEKRRQWKRHGRRFPAAFVNEAIAAAKS